MTPTKVVLPAKLIRRIELCQRCRLFRSRKKFVPGRGIAPADVMFIGEGPGRSEDIRGLAFVGPTKAIVDNAVEAAAEWAGTPQPSCFYANLVCCRPCDGQDQPNRPPSGEEAWACFQNLRLIHEAVKPTLVVLLGRVPVTYCAAPFPEAVHMLHPAYILRVGGLGSPSYLDYVRRLSEAFKGLPSDPCPPGEHEWECTGSRIAPILTSGEEEEEEKFKHIAIDMFRCAVCGTKKEVVSDRVYPPDKE